MAVVPPYIGVLKWQEKIVGTGFVVHKDGLIATCYHVLKTAGEPPAGKMFTFHLLHESQPVSAVVLDKLDPTHDLGLLHLLGALPSSLEVARLVRSDAVKNGMSFHLTGHGKISDRGHRYDYVSAAGTIAGAMKRNGVELLQLQSQQILRGMSGGPIIVDAYGGVVGVLSGRYSVNPSKHTWMRDTAWAAKSEMLAALDSKLILHEPTLSSKPTANTTGKGNVSVGTNYGSIATNGGRVINMTGGGTYHEKG